jgi:hypothetical protein
VGFKCYGEFICGRVLWQFCVTPGVHRVWAWTEPRWRFVILWVSRGYGAKILPSRPGRAILATCCPGVVIVTMSTSVDPPGASGQGH